MAQANANGNCCEAAISSSIALTKWRKLGNVELEKQKYFGEALVVIPVSPIATESSKKAPKPGLKYTGFIFGILAAASFSTAALATKILKQGHYHTFNIALWKYQGMTVFGPMMLLYFRCYKKAPIFDSILPLSKPGMKRKLFFLVCRATVGVGTMIFHTQSLQYLKLADASVIAYSTPIAVAIFGRIILGEALGVVSILVAVTTLLGVCVLTRPPLLTGAESFDTNTLIGVAFAFTAMLFLSSVFIIIRLIKEVHYSLFIVFYGYIGSLENLILASAFGVLDIPHAPMDWMYAGLSCITSLLGQFFLTMALQAELAGLVSIVRTGDVVFAFLWQIAYGIYPDSFSLIGASIVIFCILFSGFLKWLTTLDEAHPTRRKLWFLFK